MTQTGTIELSIVIPTYNGRGLLRACLSSIERWAPPHIPFEVIVSDDASTDGTAEWLADEHPGVRVVRLAQNGGFCRAANAGIAAARGRVIQLLNNDTEVTEGWVEEGLQPFADPRVGSVAPLVVMHDDPSRVDSAGDGYTLFGHPYKRGRGQSTEKWLSMPPQRVFGASGSSAFYRADLLRRVQGFDVALGSYYEDIDLALRLRNLGFTCIYIPTCKILHHVSATYDHHLPQLQRRMARNAEVIYWTRTNWPQRVAGAIPRLAFLTLQLIHRLATRRARAFLLGKLDALRMLALRPNQSLPRPHFAQRGETPTMPV
jgi:GT2 family glycosyltransferase